MFKANYKVFIKSTGKYYSGGYRSKATWSSIGWVISAAKDAAKKHGGISNIEIHEFPVASAVVHTLAEMLEAEKEKQMSKDELAAAQKKRQEIANAKAEYQKGVERMKAAKLMLEKFGIVVPTENTQNF